MSVFEHGKKYFIRTVAFYYTGELIGQTDTELVLSQAAWIADTGRFHEAMESGKFSEIEPYPDDMKVIVSRASIIDACEWPHDLPRKVL
jgi:hypothetical protein